MKDKKILFIIILSVIIILFGVMFLITYQNFKNNSSIHCIMEDKLQENKMEIYYDFKDGQVYRYSIVNTNKLTENINIEAYEKAFQNSNRKYKGSTGKFWTNDKYYVTTEIYDLNLLTEDEFKEITGMSLNELKTKSRREIIDSIVPMSNSGTFKCD